MAGWGKSESEVVAVGGEELLEAFASVVEAGHHGAEGNVENLGDFVVGLLFDVEEYDGFTGFSGQGLEGAADQGDSGFAVQAFAGDGGCGGVGVGVVGGESGFGCGTFGVGAGGGVK